jgi:RHS repeat-associated protein
VYNVDTRVDELDTAEYTYNGNGDVLTAENSAGTTEFTYDLLGRTVSATEGGATVGYTYDAEGNRLTVTYPGSEAVTTAYDLIGNAVSITDHDGTGAIYTYDFEQRLIKATYTDGSTTEYDYNKSGRLVEQKEVTPGNSTLRSLTYSYDDAGNLMTENRTGVKYDRRSEMIAYAYDRADKLVSEKIDGVTKTNTYDKAGNLVSDGTYTYTYDRQNRLTQKTGTGGTTTYTYDNSGNLISEASPSGTATYTYNAQDRLIKGEKSTGETSEYVYNALGIRVSNIQTRENQNAGHSNADLDNGSVHIQDYTPALDDDRATWQRVWESEVGTTAQNDFEAVTKQYVVDYTSGIHRDILIIENGSFEQRYVYGADAERLSVEFSFADGTERGTTNVGGEYGENLASDFSVNDITKVWYRVNMLGTSLYVVDESYTIRAHAEYDIWGDPLTETYADANYSGLEELVSFTSYAWDVTLELYFAQNRFYNADEHRFTQQDPVKDGGNWYVYVGNNPATRIDPNGLFGEGIADWFKQAGKDIAKWSSDLWDDVSSWTADKINSAIQWMKKEYLAIVKQITESIQNITKHFSDPTRVADVLLGVTASMVKSLLDSGAVPLAMVLDFVHSLTKTRYSIWYYEQYVKSSDALVGLLAAKMTYPDSFYFGKMLGDVGLMSVGLGLGATGIMEILGGIAAGTGGTVAGAAVSATGAGALVGVPAIGASITAAIGAVVEGGISIAAGVALFASGYGNFGDDRGNYDYFSKIEYEAKQYFKDWSKGKEVSGEVNMRVHYDEHSDVGAKNLADYGRKARAFRDTVIKNKLKGRPVDGFTENVYRFNYNGKYIDLEIINQGSTRIFKIISYGVN